MEHSFELNIEINVNKIDSITPCYERDRPATLIIKTMMTGHKAEKLFYHLWDRFEDDWLIKCLEAEGYTLTKIEDSI